MIVMMTEKQYNSALSRRVVEEAHIVIVSHPNGVYSVKKNRFGDNRINLSKTDIHDIIDAYFTLVATWHNE